MKTVNRVYQKSRGWVTLSLPPFAVVLLMKHITEGICGSLNECALALAIKDIPGFKKSLDYVEVRYNYLYLFFKDGEIHKYKVPKGLAIQMWDRVGFGLEPNHQPLKPGTYVFGTAVKKEYTPEEKEAIRQRRLKQWPSEKTTYKKSKGTPPRKITNVA